MNVFETLVSHSLFQLIVTVVLPLLSILLVFLGVRTARLTLARAVTPQIECYLRYQPSTHVIEMMISNFGMGSAYEVAVNIQADDQDFAAHGVIMTWRKTIVPFPIIEPGGCIPNVLGPSPRLAAEPMLKPFVAVVTYQWQPFWARRRSSTTKFFHLDVSPFSHLGSVLEKNAVAEVLKAELAKIHQALAFVQRPPALPNTRNIERVALERLESLMPALFAEMRADLITSPLKREFITLSKRHIYNAGRKRPLAYHCEDHEDLDDKVGLLANAGAVTDITYNNTNRYVMSEPLVEYLEDTRSASEGGGGTITQNAD